MIIKKYNQSALKNRIRPPRLIAIGLAVVFLLITTDLCQAAGTPAQAADPMHTPAGPARDDIRREWVFVDTSVAGYRDLVADLAAGGHDGRRIEVVLLDSRRNGVTQMAAALAGTRGIDALHLITHGSPAALQLGSVRLTADSMSGAYAEALTAIGRALTADGDILVYGCDFGQGDRGRQLLLVRFSYAASGCTFGRCNER